MGKWLYLYRQQNYLHLIPAGKGFYTMSASHELNRYHLCNIASRLFREKGFDEVTMNDIARAADMPLAELFAHFGNKQDIILFLFQSINTDWQLYVHDLSSRHLADRFEEAVLYKLTLMKPFLGLLSNMMGMLLQHSRVGVQAAGTSHIRAQGLYTIGRVLDGADDAGYLRKKVGNLASLLYLLHWGILFLYVQSGDEAQAAGSARLAARMLRRAGSRAFLLALFPFLKDMGAWSGRLLDVEEDAGTETDKAIRNILFNYRKTTEALHAPAHGSAAGDAQLLNAIHAFTAAGKPVHFILPAFPAKSPNPRKVLGRLPDLGEQIGLLTLEAMCGEIRKVYAPGAQVTICSDGRIFSGLVGVSDEDVTRYVARIREMIVQLSLSSVAIVNLEDLMEAASFNEGRKQVLERYAEPLEALRKRVKTNEAFAALYNGIHRFITEDRIVMHPEWSRSKVKETSKTIALEVIRHSNAWTRFLAYVFPGAIRLSIHPYPPGSDKIGFRLTRAADNWLTPWHGVIVLQHDEYLLMKRSDAEALNARLVYKDDQPYYYTLTDQ